MNETPDEHRVYLGMAWVGLGGQALMWLFLAPFTDLSVPTGMVLGNLVYGALALLVWLILVLLTRPTYGLPPRALWGVRTLSHLAQGAAFFQLLPLFNTVPAYMIATHSGPLWDARLDAFDRMLGVDVVAMYGWAEAHPIARWVLNGAYESVPVQFVTVLLVLVVLSRLRDLYEMAAILMWGAFLGMFVFWAVPAEGPFALHELEPNEVQAGFLETFRQLRAHEMRSITSGYGLVTFPSFHVFFALCITWSTRHSKPLLAAFVLLNLANISATMTTGWHFFADVLGGFVLFGLVTLLVRGVEPVLRRRILSSD